jgi:hypothetical protein
VSRRRWSEGCMWKDCRRRGREGGAGSSDAPSGGWRLLEKEKTEENFFRDQYGSSCRSVISRGTQMVGHTVVCPFFMNVGGCT